MRGSRLAMALGLWVMAGAVIAEDKPETPEQQFKSKDTDKDGKVSLKEFIAGESKAWVANKTAYFKAIDKDGDGYLTPREFKDGIEHPPQLKKEKKKKAK